MRIIINGLLQYLVLLPRANKRCRGQALLWHLDSMIMNKNMSGHVTLSGVGPCEISLLLWDDDDSINDYLIAAMILLTIQCVFRYVYESLCELVGLTETVRR